jgi:hypothetical protein
MTDAIQAENARFAPDERARYKALWPQSLASQQDLPAALPHERYQLSGGNMTTLIEAALERMALAHNAQTVALVTLVQMLERRGVLEKGAYLAAIKDTINRPDADFGRADYQDLQHLAQFLEGHF